MTDLRIFNSPAGSGKSTEIRDHARKWSSHNPLDRMLCVTYTNRAADEIRAGCIAPNVDVATIHSFTASFMSPFFGLPEVVSLYLNVYKEAIEARILNADDRPHIEQSNARFRERIGEPLTFDRVSDSIDRIYYNEMQFSSLLSGGLSHSDLLSFANICASAYPGVKRKLSAKYRQIIIDEYQDTSVETLEFFVDSIKGSNTSLHLYGDPMQQIYQSSSTRLRSVLSQFVVERRTVTNFRSSSAIVDSLNRVYNDPNVAQEPYRVGSPAKPRVYITNSPTDLTTKLADSESLVLSVHNQTIFDNIGTSDLVRALKSIPEYGFTSRYRPVDILMEPDWREVKDPVVQLLFGIVKLEELYSGKNYGQLIQVLRRYPKVFGILPVQSHADKARLQSELDQLISLAASDHVSIRRVVAHLVSVGHVSSSPELLESEAYAPLMDVEFLQVRRMCAFNQRPRWSTQHGVKGESHNKVILLAGDSSNPPVHMYKLFNLWPDLSFDLRTLDESCSIISASFDRAINSAAGYFSKPSREAYSRYSELITSQAIAVQQECSNLPLFKLIFDEVFETYLRKQNTTSAAKLFKFPMLSGLDSAYRLFYVGCSRAREDLSVVVDGNKLEDVNRFTEKFESLGFEVTFSD